MVLWSVTCVYVESPSFAKYRLIALAVMDFPVSGAAGRPMPPAEKTVFTGSAVQG